MSDPEQDPRWRRGLELRRERAWFEAHEALEDCWRELPPGPQREAAQGVIQAAVALEHLRRGNAIGAEKVWARAQARWGALASWPLESGLAAWARGPEDAHAMDIGIPKEIRSREHRVGLTPSAVKEEPWPASTSSH